jgi:serine/threonine-protein kinase RsbT
MNHKASWTEIARLPINKTRDVLLARSIGRDEASRLGLDARMQTVVVTAISEISRNVVQHAGSPGEFRLGKISDEGKCGLRIIVSDKGHGIERAERFTEKSSGATLGSGLGSTSRVMDQFDIESIPGAGTTVTMDLWKRKETP